VLVTSRSFEEYWAMFDLDEDDLRVRVLDCGAGGSGFAAEASRRGCKAVAVDPAYGRPRADLVRAMRAGEVAGTSIVDRYRERFTWDWYGSPLRRAELRSAAASRFLAHFTRLSGAYVAAELPRLPFREASFDLVLCSHLLFTWSDRLDEQWHRSALDEMVRVSGAEVRVFPLVVQGTGESATFLGGLCSQLRASGLAVDVSEVPYEFQRGANRMLVVRRVDATSRPRA
jgi:SAM-dependent methyltransferase